KIRHVAAETQSIDEIAHAAGDDQRERDVVAAALHASAEQKNRGDAKADRDQAVEDDAARERGQPRSQAEKRASAFGVNEREHAVIARLEITQMPARDDLRHLVGGEDDDNEGNEPKTTHRRSLTEPDFRIGKRFPPPAPSPSPWRSGRMSCSASASSSCSGGSALPGSTPLRPGFPRRPCRCGSDR